VNSQEELHSIFKIDFTSRRDILIHVWNSTQEEENTNLKDK